MIRVLDMHLLSVSCDVRSIDVPRSTASGMSRHPDAGGTVGDR